MTGLWLSCVCRYNEKMRSFTSGVRAVNLARCDIVDVIHIDGDIHTVGSSGTVLVGFHTAGQVKIEPAAKPQRKSEPELQPERKQEEIMEIAEEEEEEEVDRQGVAGAAVAAAAAASGELGFFGEMMRFTCCTADFTTKIIGPQTYVVEAFYQESGNFEFHLSDERTETTKDKTGLPTGSLAAKLGDAPRGRVAINGIKHFTMFAEPHSLMEDWNGAKKRLLKSRLCQN